MKRDWKKYNKSLVQRFTFYISRDTCNKWQEELAIALLNKSIYSTPYYASYTTYSTFVFKIGDYSTKHFYTYLFNKAKQGS